LKPDRLTSETWKDSGGGTIYAFAWDYDPVGNRTYQNQDGLQAYYDYNAWGEELREEGRIRSRQRRLDDRRRRAAGATFLKTKFPRHSDVDPPDCGRYVARPYLGLGRESRRSRGWSR